MTPPAHLHPARAGAPRRLATTALAAAAGWALWHLAASAAREARAYRRDAATLRDVWADVGGRPVRARLATPGRAAARGGDVPIVLVHGFGVSSAYWVPLAARLGRTHRVLVPDLAGHGDSPDPAEPVGSVETLAANLAEWLDAFGLDRVALVANSMGCQTAAELAAREPDRVAALVLIGPTVDPDARSLLRQVGRLAASAPYEDVVLDALVVRDYARLGPSLLAGELRAMLGHHIERVLPRVAAPTLVLRGEHDHIAPRRWVARAANLAEGRWAEIAGAGHAAHFDEPDQVASAIRALLAGSASARGRGREGPAWRRA